ncbi:MAG: hypothetical protein EOP47_31125 [Sphingobacteriaceae bacterium]|nr:MAG: hypothetical protein EOP47_31125 [Sphingobacteriaceae bacterium]
MLTICTFATGKTVSPHKANSLPPTTYTVHVGAKSDPSGYIGYVWITPSGLSSFADRVTATQNYTVTCSFYDPYNNSVSYSVTVYAGYDYGIVNTYMGPFMTTPQPYSVTGSGFYGGYPITIDPYLYTL